MLIESFLKITLSYEMPNFLVFLCFYELRHPTTFSSMFFLFIYHSTFKQGCEMHIRFGVSDDGSQLVVKSMSELHNHEINEVSENHYFSMFDTLYKGS